jgi:hypothetical protein
MPQNNVDAAHCMSQGPNGGVCQCLFVGQASTAIGHWNEPTVTDLFEPRVGE